jgi:hypothetical protein
LTFIHLPEDNVLKLRLLQQKVSLHFVAGQPHSPSVLGIPSIIYSADESR